MLTLLLIVFVEHPEKTHKIKTLKIKDDNERLQLCCTMFLSIIKEPPPQVTQQFAQQAHGDNLIRIESGHYE